MSSVMLCSVQGCQVLQHDASHIQMRISRTCLHTVGLFAGLAAGCLLGKGCAGRWRDRARQRNLSSLYQDWNAPMWVWRLTNWVVSLHCRTGWGTPGKEGFNLHNGRRADIKGCQSKGSSHWLYHWCVQVLVAMGGPARVCSVVWAACSMVMQHTDSSRGSHKHPFNVLLSYRL